MKMTFPTPHSPSSRSSLLPTPQDINPFVGVSQELLCVEKLRELLLSSSSNPTYYFLRWPHKVSGILAELPADFPSPEGQMFNGDRELRWRQQGQHFSVLLLSTTGAQEGFKPVGQEWRVENRPAYLYPSNETRFPRGFDYQNINVAQRYVRIQVGGLTK